MHDGFPTTEASPQTPRPSSFEGNAWRLTLCSLGIVFGDIGTSPLYTLKECLIVAARDRPRRQIRSTPWPLRGPPPTTS